MSTSLLDHMRGLPDYRSPLESLDHQDLLAGTVALMPVEEIHDIDELAAELACIAEASDITVLRHVRASAEKRAAEEIADRIVDANPSVIGKAAPIFAETLTQEIQQYGGERFPVFKERPLGVLGDELSILASDAEARKNYAVFVNDLVYGSKPSFDEVSQTFRMAATGFLAAAAELSLAEQPQQITISWRCGGRT
jgi:hypothetical protein